MATHIRVATTMMKLLLCLTIIPSTLAVHPRYRSWLPNFDYQIAEASRPRHHVVYDQRMRASDRPVMAVPAALEAYRESKSQLGLPELLASGSTAHALIHPHDLISLLSQTPHSERRQVLMDRIYKLLLTVQRVLEKKGL